MIWPQASDRPEPYTGILTVDSAPVASEDEETTPSPTEPLASTSKKGSKPSGTGSDQEANPSPSKKEPAPEKDFNALDDLLELFPDQVAESTDAPPVPEPATDEQIPFSAPPQTTTRLKQPMQSTTATGTTDDMQIEQMNQDVLDPNTNHGTAFLRWLKDGVISHKVIINDAKARVHTVDGTAFLVSPDIFKRYALENPSIERQARERDLEAWQLVQRAFEKLKKHRKTPTGLNIWTCLVKGPRKSKELRGYLLTDPTEAFSEVPYDNPVLTLVNLADKETSE